MNNEEIYAINEFVPVNILHHNTFVLMRLVGTFAKG